MWGEIVNKNKGVGFLYDKDRGRISNVRILV